MTGLTSQRDAGRVAIDCVDIDGAPTTLGVARSLEPGFGDYAETSECGDGSVELESGLFVFDGTLSTD